MTRFLRYPSFVLTAIVVAVLFVAFPIIVLAQQAAATSDPLSLATQLITAAQGHQWGIVAGVVLSAVTYGVRTWVFPGWAWAKTDRGGVVLALIVSVVGTVSTALLTGHATLGTVLDAVSALLLSSGAYTVVKKTLAPADSPGAIAKAAGQPKGFVRHGALGLLLLFSLAACTTLSALSGSTGPIPVSSGKDAAGNTVTTSSVTVTAQPVTGTPPACAKPVSVSFDTISGYHNQCSVDVPVPPVAGVCQ